MPWPFPMSPGHANGNDNAHPMAMCGCGYTRACISNTTCIAIAIGLSDTHGGGGGGGIGVRTRRGVSCPPPPNLGSQHLFGQETRALLYKSAAVNFDDFIFLIAPFDSESYRDYKSYGIKRWRQVQIVGDLCASERYKCD